MYLHYLFVIIYGERVRRVLRCILSKIQGKTEPVTAKVGKKSGFVVLTCDQFEISF